MKKRLIAAVIAAALITGMTSPGARAQQGGTTRFVYDENGRLKAVISPDGEAAAYEYDAAGNLTAIRRISADTLSLLDFSPHEGGAGDEVTFAGTGFNAGVLSVSFNGSQAQIVSVSPSGLAALVPDSATTGPVAIVTPRGTLITPVPFVVVSRVRVFPSAATLLPGDTLPFSAIVAGGGDQSVVWSVNGIVGGSPAIGTVTSGGLYLAPGLPGNESLSVVVRATSAAQPNLFADAHVKILNPNALGALTAALVSVRSGDPRGIAAARAPFTSIRRGTAISGTAAALSQPLSLRLGVSSPVSNVVSPFVSATTGPAISGISPSTIARGETITLTVNGANLGEASSLRFLSSTGALDIAITATNLAANSDGSQVTAAVSVGPTAATGVRVVVLTSPAGTTLPLPAGANTITIQ